MARSATVNIRLYQPRIRQLNRAMTTALKKTGEAVHSDIIQAQVMPFDRGTLQNESTFVDDSNADRGHVAIVSSTPYARRMYFHPEYNFQTHENPSAGGKWFDDWLPGGRKEAFVQETFNRLYREEAGL